MRALIQELRCPQRLALCAALVFAAHAGAHGTQAHSKVDETVSLNGKRLVSAAAVDFMTGLQVAKGRAPDESLRAEVTRALLARAAMAREARTAGLADSPRVKAEIEVATNQILAQAYEARLRAQFVPTETQLRQRYEALKAAQLPSNSAQPFPAFDDIKARIADLLAQEALDERVDRATRAVGTEQVARRR